MAEKTASEIRNEKIKSFFKKAVTRTGAKHKILKLQSDGSGNIITVTGTVQDKTAGSIEMLWNFEGKSLVQPALIYDLVTEETL